MISLQVPEWVWPLIAKKRRITDKFRFWLLVKLRLIQMYQPVPWLGLHKTGRAEATIARWNAIENELRNHPQGTVLDLGCQIGYFSFKMGERGFLCMGVESGRIWIESGRIVARLSELPNVTFRQMHLSTEAVKSLPTVDVVFCLSLWQHICKEVGFEESKEFMKELLKRTRSTLIFETGQSNEDYMSWAKDLPEMLPTPQEWLSEFLIQCGASRVVHLGEFETNLGPVKRHLLAAYVSDPSEASQASLRLEAAEEGEAVKVTAVA